MLEIIKEQFRNGKALTQSRYYGVIDKSHYPKFYWDLHPYNQEYYHELNPFFLFNLYKPDLLELGHTLTVKDGLASFTNYMLNNYALISKRDVLFIIPPSFTSVVPENLRSKFCGWELNQPKKIKIKDAKKVLIFGVLNESYLGSLSQIKDKLMTLNTLPKEAVIEVFLPMRRNPFIGDKESLLHLEVIDLVVKTLPGRSFTFLKSPDFNDKSDFKDCYFLDLTVNRMIIGDSYLHYSIASKGGTVSSLKSTPPEDSLFDLALSFNHNLHVVPLPKVDSIFPELLYTKKQLKSEPLYDTSFFKMLEEKVKTDF